MSNSKSNTNSESDQDNKRPWYRDPGLWGAMIGISFAVLFFIGYLIYDNRAGSPTNKIRALFESENGTQLNIYFKQIEEIERSIYKFVGGDDIPIEDLRSFWEFDSSYRKPIN